ncbi:alpha-ketoglutarate-dependent dioxygenase AlkB (plasmid) [Anabaena sp. FACHB-709]|uniref:alpha-ketoglutarate-dependent dioxygenase AlkB n=1 Tax=Nostocaceae TaxID=1162 RepID=UPI001E56D063|nr:MULTISPECIES: alpha-ketoglutarate-dependent dioxygenase AlkB [Nostocaceae]
MILQERYGRSQNSQDVFLHRSCKCITKLRELTLPLHPSVLVQYANFRLSQSLADPQTDFWLEHGSLLLMHPGCQSTHLHQLPKTNKVVGTRINLTFRPHTGGKR